MTPRRLTLAIALPILALYAWAAVAAWRGPPPPQAMPPSASPEWDDGTAIEDD